MLEKEERSNQVKSVKKALLILEELSLAGQLSVKELSLRLSLDKATIHRLLSTLKDCGYVNQNKNNRNYANSMKIFAMGTRVMEKAGLKQAARPFVEELAEKTGETVNLSARSGGDVIYIDKIESSSTIKVGISIGTSVPGYCTGMGKAVLAYLPAEEQKNALADVVYRKYTANTADNQEVLLQRLEKVRAAGFSMDDEEFVEGLISFGAPIFDFYGMPVGAISVSCPKYRFDQALHEDIYAHLVMDMAEKISLELGYLSSRDLLTSSTAEKR